MATFRRLRSPVVAAILIVAAVATGCAESARIPFSAGVGPDPVLPPPNPTRIPTVHFAPAKGWPDGGTPTTAPGATGNVVWRVTRAG